MISETKTASTAMLEGILIHNTAANKLAPKDTELAKKECKKCGEKVDEYIKAGEEDSPLVERIDAAGEYVLDGTGITCKACIAMGDYVCAKLTGCQSEMDRIAQEYPEAS